MWFGAGNILVYPPLFQVRTSVLYFNVTSAIRCPHPLRSVTHQITQSTSGLNQDSDDLNDEAILFHESHPRGIWDDH